jgi:hypothetical protein
MPTHPTSQLTVCPPAGLVGAPRPRHMIHRTGPSYFDLKKASG